MAVDFDSEEFQQAHEITTTELINYVPPSWTTPEAKVRGGVFWTLMSACGLVMTFLKALLVDAIQQIRIKTAWGSTLDVMSQDYLGNEPSSRLRRHANETDNDFRDRLLAEILQERATRGGVSAAVERLTGAAPSIFEPFNVLSTGAWHGEFNGAYIPIHFNFAWGNADHNFDGTVKQFNGPNAGLLPQSGVGAFGDLTVKYTFFVNVLNNPKGASLRAIEDVVDRVRPVGVRGIVYVTGQE